MMFSCSILRLHGLFANLLHPPGQVPFIKAGSFLVADLERIITFAGYKVGATVWVRHKGG